MEHAMNLTNDSRQGAATAPTAQAAAIGAGRHDDLNAGPYRTAADPLGRLVRHFGPISRRELSARYLIQWQALVGFAIVTAGSALWYGRGYELAAAGIGIAVLVFLGTIVSQPQIHVDVHQHGLRWRSADRHVDARWSDIIVVRADLRRTRRGRATSGRYRYHVTTFDDRYVVLSEHISDVLELGAIVQRETLPYIMQRIVDQLSSGHPVTIDRNARVTSAGITAGKQMTPWSAVRSIEMMGGTLRVPPVGTWPTARIDNAHALVPLLRVFVEEAQPPAAGPKTSRAHRA